MAQWTKGILASTASDVGGALKHLPRIAHPTIGRSAALDRLDAAIRADRPDLARLWIEELSSFTAAVTATTTGNLTPQERQTALLVSSGLGNREIAARLFLSPRTVEYHLSNAYQKLGVRTRGMLAQLDLS